MAAAQAGGLVGFGPRGARSTGGHDPFFWVDDPFFRVTETPDTGKLNWLRLEGLLKWCHDSCQYIYIYICVYPQDPFVCGQSGPPCKWC